MLKPNNVIRIPCNKGYKFFIWWLEFLRPFHHLSDREIAVAAAILYKRYELSKVISDTELLDKVLMSEDSRKHILVLCNKSGTHFQVIMSRLRKTTFLPGGKVNAKYIPKISESEDKFNLLVFFDFSNNGEEHTKGSL